MRTSIVIEDQLASRIKEEAQRRGISVSRFFSEAAKKDLVQTPKTHKPFTLITCKGKPYPGINLDKTSDLLAAEDETFYGNPHE